MLFFLASNLTKHELTWQASLPPSGIPAHTILSVTELVPYAALQSSRLTRGTSTTCSWLGEEPPSVSAPHPEIWLIAPGTMGSLNSGKATGATADPKERVEATLKTLMS